MVYKPPAVRVALIAGFRQALPVFNLMIVVAAAVGMWESPQGFPGGVGRVESRLYGLSMLSIPRHFHGLFWPQWSFKQRVLKTSAHGLDRSTGGKAICLCRGMRLGRDGIRSYPRAKHKTQRWNSKGNNPAKQSAQPLESCEGLPPFPN
jgi:hypothetical protein